MNRYSFSIYNCEYSNDIYFLHEKEYNDKEFRKLMNDVIKKAITLHVDKQECDAFHMDDEYSFDSYNDGPVYVKPDYKSGFYLDCYSFVADIPTYMEEIVSIMKDEYGFVVEELDRPKASLSVDEYQHINQNFKEHLYDTYKAKIERDNIPVITQETMDSINEVIAKIDNCEEDTEKFKNVLNEAKRVMLEFINKVM